jgi:hypothetical protein
MAVNRMQAWMGSDDFEPAVVTADEQEAFSPAPLPVHWLSWQCRVYQWAYEQAILQMAPSLYELASRPSLN